MASFVPDCDPAFHFHDRDTCKGIFPAKRTSDDKTGRTYRIMDIAYYPDVMSYHVHLCRCGKWFWLFHEQLRQSDIEGFSCLPGACLGVGLSAFALALTTSASMAIIICFPLGFFAGAIYPCCLGYCVDYAGSSSARATAMITASTGLGGTLIAGSFGYMSQYGGMRFAFLCLGALMIIDLLVAFILIGKTRKERGIS